MIFEFLAAHEKAQLAPTKAPKRSSRNAMLRQIFNQRQCVFMQLDAPRQPRLIWEGCTRVAEPEGTQAGGTGSLRLVQSTGAWLSGPLTVCPNTHTLACQPKPLLGFTDICIACPPWFTGNRYLPRGSGASRFPRRGEAGALPRFRLWALDPVAPSAPKRATAGCQPVRLLECRSLG